LITSELHHKQYALAVEGRPMVGGRYFPLLQSEVGACLCAEKQADYCLGCAVQVVWLDLVHQQPVLIPLTVRVHRVVMSKVTLPGSATTLYSLQRFLASGPCQYHNQEDWTLLADYGEVAPGVEDDAAAADQEGLAEYVAEVAESSGEDADEPEHTSSDDDDDDSGAEGHGQ
jgi:hypothetical protein